MKLDEICALPVADIAADPSHLYLWVPNARAALGKSRQQRFIVISSCLVVLKGSGGEWRWARYSPHH